MKYGSGISIIEQDRNVVRDLVQTLDGAGFDFTTLGGHILAAPEGRYDGRPPFTYMGPFHDHFVLFAYLSGITERIHFLSSILILPLFPTALVAKQAAELQYVSGGRFELGIGISWSPEEYTALGQNLRNRANRMGEQVELLRRFWKEPYVDFEGKYHKVEGLGLNRQPIDIPVWFGTTPVEEPMRRLAKLADGWIPQGDFVPAMPKLREYLAAEGRDPALLQLMGRLVATPEGPSAWVETAKQLQANGVTHIGIGSAPGTSPADGLKAVLEAKKVLSEEIG
jgi:alkanesulfonate monooxygenase SsuD/methylene tetrahydromethanopterin reductase-like flavin-dependent oxidoreductase (luciferase family)